MLKHFALFATLFAVPACLDASEPAPDPVSPPSAVELKPAAPGIHIDRVAWTWHGCGPGASPLPFSIAVDVVGSGSTPYAVKGQAVGCDAFDANDELEPCRASPFAIVRTLTVSVSDATGSDTRTIPLNDCVDGKAGF